MRKAAYILIAMMLPLCTVAQGVLSGTVSDKVSGARLEFVNIGVMGSTSGTATDAGGHYRLAIASDDSVTVRFSFTGYEPQEYRLRVRGERTLDVRLAPRSRVLDQVEVREERSRQTAFEHISVEKLNDAVGPSGGVESLLKTLPDVSSNNELSSQYSVRGGSFDENMVYINGVELFRPMLIRSGQQEGMSIINPDMVDYILFSPGGFDATYGDRLSSALDITYGRQRERGLKLSASLLGASATLTGSRGDKLTYAVGARHHSNSYVLGSMDTRGDYTTKYTDVQAVASYRPTERTQIDVLGIWTRNVYGLVPESMTTSFGGLQQYMELDVYFDGMEQDRYHTLHGAVIVHHRINDDWKLLGSVSAQRIVESERYDVQSQYWLYELGMGEVAGETERFDRGVGTFLEHASNRLRTNIFAAELRATRHARLGQWDMGIKVQGEFITDHLREWRLVDSAGYAIPFAPQVPGDSANVPHAPILQNFINADNILQGRHATLFVQRELNFSLHGKADLKVLVGARGHLYSSEFGVRRAENEADASAVSPLSTLRSPLFLFSPRMSVSCKPEWKEDILFRLAAGVYSQPPFYREYRRPDGSLAEGLKSQKSYQAVASADWNLLIWEKPFKLTADVYYKYITDLIPYTVDNLRLLYHPDQDAVGYAAGVSLRLNGEFVKGMESWASLSLMRAREDILGDTLGWLPRPTDQLVSFKVFLQDNIPQIPWWKMSLSMLYGSPLPIETPGYPRTDSPLRMKSYFRVDWGNTVELTRFDAIRQWKMLKHVKEVLLGVEVFNLFNYRNVISYLWVSDYEGHPFRVPNYLTARQLNVRLTVTL